MDRARISRVTDLYALAEGAELEEQDLAEPDDLKIKLLSIFRSPEYMPPVLPEVAIELTQLSRRPNVSYTDVIQVLERDPIVVADVLKVAQSPLYSTRNPVQSLSDAMNRLGIQTLRDIVWQIAANSRLFRVKAYTAPMRRLQAHSMFTAHMARLIAGHAGIASEHAFLCGLLHDMGVCGTLIALTEHSPSPPPALEQLWPALDRMHSEASGIMARLWGLAPEVCHVLEHHHPDNARNHLTNPLVAVVCVAETLADQLDWGIAAKEERERGLQIDRNFAGHHEAAIARLNLQRRLTAITQQAERIAEKLTKPSE